MSKTVLIVEDNELNMKLFHDLLEAHGYSTLQTYDGLAALDMARGLLEKEGIALSFGAKPANLGAIEAELVRMEGEWEAHVEAGRDHVMGGHGAAGGGCGCG